MSKYRRNKRLLIQLLGTVALPKGLAHYERSLQLSKGVLPAGVYNVHHLYPKSAGGSDRVGNLSVMEVPQHKCLHHKLDRVAKHFEEKDRPALASLARSYGALTLEDLSL